MPELKEIVENLEQSTDIDKRVLEVYRALTRYASSSARQEWKKRRDECWDAIAENKMWSADEEEEMRNVGQVPLVVNRMSKGVQGSSAMVTDQKPTINFHPVGDGDLYVSALLKRAFDAVWNKSDGNQVSFDVVEECKIGGLGVYDIDYDKSKGAFGRIVIDESKPDEIYFDHESRKRDFSDTDIIKAKLRTKKYIKEVYGDDVKDEDLSYDPVSAGGDEEKSEGITGGDNYAVDVKDGGAMANKPVRNVWEIEAWMLKREKEYWIIVQDEEGNPRPIRPENAKRKPKEEELAAIPGFIEVWPRLMEKRYQRVIVGRKLLEENENPYGVDADGDPVVRIVGLKHDRTRTAYPTSPSFKALPINKEKNKRRSQFIFSASKNIHGTLVRDDGSRWVGKPHHPKSEILISKNTQHVPFLLQQGNMDIERFILLEDRADNDIDDAYDMHDVMRGQLPQGSGKLAGRTIIALQDMGGMMSKPFLRSLEGSLVRVAKTVISLMLQHWPRYMWERLLEESEMVKPPDGVEVPEEMGQDQEAQFRQEVAQEWQRAIDRIKPAEGEPAAISLVDIDVRLAAGSSMPTNRMAKLGVATEMFQAGIYDREAVLKFIDDPEKDLIAQRMKAQEQALAEAEMMKKVKK